MKQRGEQQAYQRGGMWAGEPTIPPTWEQVMGRERPNITVTFVTSETSPRRVYALPTYIDIEGFDTDLASAVLHLPSPVTVKTVRERISQLLNAHPSIR